MDIRFSCSQGHSLAVDPEMAGRRVKCPVCLEIVTAPKLAIPLTAEEPDDCEEVQYVDAEEEDGYEEDRSRRRRGPRKVRYEDEEEEERYEPKRSGKLSKQDRLERVKLGLDFHLWKYVCFVFGIVFGMMGRILSGIPFLGLPVVLGSNFIVFVAFILGIVGSVFCSWVPDRAQARLLVLLALGFDVAAPVVLVLALPLALVSIVLTLVLILLAIVCGATGFALFMVFVKKLAYYLHDRPDGDEAIAAMIQALAVFFGGPVIVFLSAFILLLVPIFGVVLWIAEYIGWLVLSVLTLFRILTVLKEVRSQI
jgi:hypothetical protein